MKVLFNNTKSNRYTFKGNQNKPPLVSSFINTERLVDSFIGLAKIDSGSDEKLAENQIPSTEGQKNVAQILKGELKKIGLKDVKIDRYSIVTATLDSNIGDAPVIGFLAHMDTSPDAPNVDVKPQIHNYKGGAIRLKKGTVISKENLKPYIGQTIITSDGTTLLGADDKAGIASIIEALRVFKEHPELKHPKIRIAFTPDEETAMGVNKFNIKKFGADIAYTVDGDMPHIIENESFNAFNPEVIIEGKMTHYGTAKADGMIDAIEVANWIMNKLPKNQRPRTTEKKQGYFFVQGIQGNTAKTTMNLVVRDHDYERELKRIDYVKSLLDEAKRVFKCKIKFKLNPVYGNMKDSINGFPNLVKYTKLGVKRSGLPPKIEAIRGGTDGSNLSLRGMPTLNIGASAHLFHSKSEFAVVQEMLKSPEIIVNLAGVFAENAKEIMPEVIKRRIHL